MTFYIQAIYWGQPYAYTAAGSFSAATAAQMFENYEATAKALAQAQAAAQEEFDGSYQLEVIHIYNNVMQEEIVEPLTVAEFLEQQHNGEK